jgi:small-conductance mechanosensitive channel
VDSHLPSNVERAHHAVALAALLVARTSLLFIMVVAVYVASRDLTFPAQAERFLTVGMVLVFWAQVGGWAMAAVSYAIDLKRRRTAGHDVLLNSSINLIVFAAAVTIWSTVLLLALDNLDIQIKPLLAGLGIGGIAVALAVQAVLGDLLASMSIALDRPFSVGDLLVVGDYQGTVEHIGVKSTCLRSITGEQIIMGNTDILKSRVRNYGRMSERCSVFQFGVSYETAPETLAAIPVVVREIVAATPNTRFDRCHFLHYGAATLQFEVSFFTTTADFRTYVDARQQINLAIFERLRAMKVSLTPPSRMAVSFENSPPAATVGAQPGDGL